MISLFREIFLAEQYTGEGFYQPRPGDTVIDLGANIGTFALFLQHRARGIQVHCFEPGADTRQRLERNVRANRLEPWVRIYPVGVSDAAKRLVLQGHRFAGSRSTVPGAPGALDVDREEITCVPLEQAVRMTGADRVDLLKIDVEGAEADILAARDPSLWARIRRVALEFHGSIRPGSREAVTAALVACGFRICQVIEPTPGAIDGVLRAIR
jgi:FkbM family methyltransferase